MPFRESAIPVPLAGAIVMIPGQNLWWLLWGWNCVDEGVADLVGASPQTPARAP